MILATIATALMSFASLSIEWGALDSVIAPRAEIRVWIKISNHDNNRIDTLDNLDLVPNWSINTKNGDTIKLSGSGYIGSFKKKFIMHPGNGLFMYDMVNLFNVTGDIAKGNDRVSLIPSFGQNHSINGGSKTFKLLKSDNEYLEKYLSKYDSLKKYASRTRTPINFCGIFSSEWNRLSNANQIFGNAAKTAYLIRRGTCNEKYDTIFQSNTGSWHELDAASSCIYEKEHKNIEFWETRRLCKFEINAFRSATQKLSGATKVLDSESSFKLVTPNDTFEIFPIDYWQIQPKK